jgi:hypothetical protein
MRRPRVAKRLRRSLEFARQGFKSRTAYAISNGASSIKPPHGMARHARTVTCNAETLAIVLCPHGYHATRCHANHQSL